MLNNMYLNSSFRDSSRLEIFCGMLANTHLYYKAYLPRLVRYLLDVEHLLYIKQAYGCVPRGGFEARSCVPICWWKYDVRLDFNDRKEFISRPIRQKQI
jgi:hypothetical protein